MIIRLSEQAKDWGMQNGFDEVTFVSATDKGEYYHITDSSIKGKKTGLPRFIFLGFDCSLDRSYNWSIQEIKRLLRLYCARNRQQGAAAE